MSLKKQFGLCPSGIAKFQLGAVIDVAGIIKIAGAGGTFFLARTAFDADAGKLRDVRRIDRPHGADRGASAAADAFYGIDLRLDFKDIDRNTGPVAGRIIGAKRITALDIDRMRQVISAADHIFSPGSFGENIGDPQIFLIRPSCSQNAGK